MRFTSSIFIALTTLLYTTNGARSCKDDLTVETPGGTVHGFIDSSTPSPALPFGNLTTTSLGPACMQYLSTLPNIYINETTQFNPGGGTTLSADLISEDCLTLSIWAPRTPKTTPPLPVIIFLYGGAFTTNGVNIPYSLPPHWIQRTQSHLVVSFNHRDNIFGYPNAAGLIPQQQNVGLLDIRQAIEWVHANIALFGGDPDRIGLWGQSSGGSAIGYYTYQHTSDPLVSSAIMDSGNEFIDILTRDPEHRNFTFVAEHLGCGDLPSDRELDCMRAVPASAINDFLHGYYDSGASPITTFSPVVDNHTVFENYTLLAQEEHLFPLPALIGSNANDGIAFVPYNPSPSAADLALADNMTSVWFFCPTYLAAKTRLASYPGTPVYRYLYSGNFTDVSPKGWMGAYHGAELPMVFGTWDGEGGKGEENKVLERATSEVMQDIWVRFVESAGRETGVEGWDAGKVAEFGRDVPARVVDAREMEEACS
ncbi:hypothetical protein DL546_008297 [Coniochaeta pulveracea]|uniref:Carboxylic ester hydrolase n=1 Tax=Coniochaeta pulveracea TaxID=177199 RepID=A0A420YM38_9PEZI|nr:hypothetical protein DL546_008297 [Coniochaeta pulveracea]